MKGKIYRTSFERFLQIIGRTLFSILYRIEFEGEGNFPDKGSAILVSNHPTYLDPILLSLPTKRHIRFMAWDILFNIPILKYIVNFFDAFPINVDHFGKETLRESLRTISNGEILGIFPEGGRSTEKNRISVFKSGFIKLSIGTGTPILLATISGAFDVWPKPKLVPKFSGKIKVTFHKPLVFSPEEQERLKNDSGLSQRLADEIINTIEGAFF